MQGRRLCGGSPQKKQSAAVSKERQKLGNGCGGFSTKIHAIADAQGRLLDFVLTGGNGSDARNGPRLAEIAMLHSPAALCADKAYDSNAVIDVVLNGNARPIIPSKKNRKNPRPWGVCEQALYRQRNRIERLFARLKAWRRICLRADKRACAFASFVWTASCMDWI